MLHALDAHQPPNARGRSPPQDGALEKGPGESLEVAPGKRVALAGCELGQAARKVDQADAAALAAKRIEQRAETVADRGGARTTAAA